MADGVRTRTGGFPATNESDAPAELAAAALAQASAALTVLDLDGHVLLANEACARMHGYRPEEMVGRHYSAFHSEDQLPIVEAAAHEILERGSYSGVIPHVRRDGTPFPAWMDNEVLRDADGKPVGVVSTMRDITENQADQQDLECLRLVDEVIRGTPDLENVMGAAMAIVRKVFECDRAWLLHPCDPDAPAVRIPFESADRSLPQATAPPAAMPVHPEGAKVMAKALEVSGPLVHDPGSDAPLPQASEEFGVHSEIMLALRPRSGSPWLLGLHQCSHARVWSEREKRLLRRVGDRIESALSKLLLFRDLRAAEEEWQESFDAIGSHVFVLDEAGMILRANRAARSCFESTHREIVGMDFRSLYWGAHEPDPSRPCATILTSEEPVVIEGRSPALEGWLRFSAYPRFDGEGRRVGAMLSVRDITQRREAEEGHDRLATAIEQSAEAIVITDVDGRIQYVNPAFERISGYTREEAIGRNPRILKSGVQDRAFYRDLWETITRGDVWQGHMTNRRKDGTLYEEEATISPMRNAQGRIVNYVAVKRDVTHEAELEAKLRQSQKMEAVGRLAGGVAHDFNNQLLAILGYTEMARGRLEAGDPLRDLLAHVLEAGERSATLTRQLLAFSRRQVLERVRLDVNDVVADVMSMLRRLIGEDIELDIYPGHDLGTVLADRGQVEQILMNLAVNARDAMPGGGRLKIRTQGVTVERTTALAREIEPGAYVRLTVADTGTGMDEETKARVFEPFFTTKPVGMGTGLGLATVYGIVTQHDGAVTVESTPGEGSSFHVYLPVVDGPATEQKEVEERPAVGGTETILTAEDDEGVRRLVATILEDAGYRVITAANGIEAVEVFEERADEIDLVLLDVVMPSLGGYAARDRIAEMHPGARVLLTSGYDVEALEHVVDPADALLVLSKPYNPDVLLRRVREVLDGD